MSYQKYHKLTPEEAAEKIRMLKTSTQLGVKPNPAFIRPGIWEVGEHHEEGKIVLRHKATGDLVTSSEQELQFIFELGYASIWSA